MELKNRFIHLRTQSSYSLSESAISIDKLVELTKSSNMPAVALTDNNNMFGALEFSLKCLKNGIQPIIGTSINLYIPEFSNNTKNNILNQVSLIAKNKIGYENLLKISSKSHIESKNSIPCIELQNIINNKEGLIIYLGGIYNPLLKLHKNNKINQAKNFIEILKKAFDLNLYFELQRIENEDLDKFEEDFINLAYDYEIPLIATNNVQFQTPDYHDAHDSLLCIAEKKTINQDNRKKSNPNIYFKSSQQMKKLFIDLPESLENTYLIALKCSYAPVEETPKLPKFTTSNNISEDKELNIRSHRGLKDRLKQYSNTKDEDIYTKRLEYELETINKMGFAGYFLIVSDFINWAKNKDIPVGPGRGSGAGSVVSWSLSITDLDPIKYGLIFERFLNPERISLPDFEAQNEKNGKSP